MCWREALRRTGRGLPTPIRNPQTRPILRCTNSLGLISSRSITDLPTWCSACIATAGCWATCRLCDGPCGDVWAESLRWTGPGAPEQQAYSSSKVVAQPLIASVTSMSGTSGFTSLTFSAPGLFHTAHRFQAMAGQSGGKYLAIYETDVDPL